METEQRDDSGMVIKVTDAHLNDLYSNRALADLTGYDPADLERIGWLSVVDPQARSLFEEVVQLAGKVPYVRECFETNVVCRDGRTRTLAWEVLSLAPDQFPLMLITARESARKQLPGAGVVRSREVSPIGAWMWEEIFDALPDCVSVHDENFVILAANRALCDRLGLPRTEIVGRKCHELLHGSAQPIDHCVLIRAMSDKHGRRFRRESYERRFKGVCQIEAVAFRAGKSALRGVIHTVRTPDRFDFGSGAVTHGRLESLSRLADAAAHDYNDLLSSIVGLTGMLQTLDDLPPRGRRYVEQLQDLAERMNEITQRLLLFGRRDVAHAELLDLGRLVAEVLSSVQGTAGLPAVLYERPGEGVLVRADRFQMQAMVESLVRNALDAAGRTGGDVLVKVGMRRPTKPFPTFFALAPAGEYAAVEVRDSGPGIPAEQLATAFEPSLERGHRSTGRWLDLPVVYRIVHNHDGYIEAESGIGLGTRITVLLPAQTSAK